MLYFHSLFQKLRADLVLGYNRAPASARMTPKIMKNKDFEKIE